MSLDIKLISSIENFLKLYLGSAGGDLDSFISIDTAIDNYDFSTIDGHMCTLLKIDGRAIEDDKFVNLRKDTDLLANGINSFFSGDSHSMQFVYRRDIGRNEELIDNSLSPSAERAKKIGLEMDYYFESKKSTLLNSVVDENVYLALWTNPNCISKKAYREEWADINEELKSLPLHSKSQNIVGNYQRIKIIHDEYVKSIIDRFTNAQILISRLNRHKAVASMSKVFSPHISLNTKYIFPDDNYYARGGEGLSPKEDDPSSMLWPSISEQVVPDDEVYMDRVNDVVKISDNYFTTFEVNMPPRTLVGFNRLADSIGVGVPFQISFYINSAIGFSFFWKKIMSSFPAPATNGRLKKAIKAVDSLKLLDEANVEYKISVCTWSKKYDDLIESKEHLKQKLNSWGGSHTRNYRGSPFQALISSTQGLTNKTFGSTVYAPLSGILPQLPISRRPSIWNNSALNFIASGDKLFPYAPTGSSVQKYANIGICATMGSGKSVLLQCIADAHILSHSSSGIMPMIGYLDIGFSAEESIAIMRLLAPSAKKRHFFHLTLENSTKHAFNFHDTQLGCREPDIDQFKSIVNFYLTLLTPIGESSPHKDMSDVISAALKDAYIYLSDNNKPKEYVKGRSRYVDGILDKRGIDPQGLTFWQVVDRLFKAKEINAALVAQRYAVPTINDVIAQLNISPTIRNNFSKVAAGSGGEMIVDYTKRLLTSVVSGYPVISMPTNIDVESGRFIVVDLNNVAKGRGAAGEKETAIFYSLGRFIVSKNFFISNEILSVAPDLYHGYHKKRISVIKEIPKLLVYDEFHRVSRVESVISQLIEEMREGRKWALSVMMSSQLLRDFNETIQLLLSSTFILSNDADEPQEMRKTFGLNDHLFSYLMSECNGPDGARGTPMIARFKTKKRTVTQSLRFVLSPYEYWMKTSDPVDLPIKRKVSEVLGTLTALYKLTKLYPYGVKSVIEELSVSDNSKIRSNPEEHLVSVITAMEV